MLPCVKVAILPGRGDLVDDLGIVVLEVSSVARHVARGGIVCPLPTQRCLSRLRSSVLLLNTSALAAVLGAATATIGVQAGWRFLPDPATLERALVGIGLAMWPALAVLTARGRIGLAVTLPILVASTAFVSASSVALYVCPDVPFTVSPPCQFGPPVKKRLDA